MVWKMYLLSIMASFWVAMLDFRGVSILQISFSPMRDLFGNAWCRAVTRKPQFFSVYNRWVSLFQPNRDEQK